MKILIVVNDAPYGTEKAYNALRLAMTLQKEQAGAEVLIFLMADAVTCALPHQTTPDGYYNLERCSRALSVRVGKSKRVALARMLEGSKAFR